MLADLFHEIINAVHPTIAPDDKLHGLADELAAILERLGAEIDRLARPVGAHAADPEPADDDAADDPKPTADVPAGA